MNSFHISVALQSFKRSGQSLFFFVHSKLPALEKFYHLKNKREQDMQIQHNRLNLNQNIFLLNTNISCIV